MPNHFHFLLNITFKSIEPIKTGGLILPTISNGFRLLQSSYTKGINYQMKRTGNLFQQKTKSKLITDKVHAITVFNYIHQNPVIAHLVTKAEEWDYSSFPDYAGLRNGILCNKEKTYELLGLSTFDMCEGVRREITAEIIKNIY
jgi:REP element-mobilizing transposase RayT